MGWQTVSETANGPARSKICAGGISGRKDRYNPASLAQRRDMT
jgi:hypothetical protein